MIPTNCKNCGAVLESTKCAYCKTEYGERRVPYTEEEKRVIEHQLAEHLVGRGSLYSSVIVSAYKQKIREGKSVLAMTSNPSEIIVCKNPRANIYIIQK